MRLHTVLVAVLLAIKYSYVDGFKGAGVGECTKEIVSNAAFDIHKFNIKKINSDFRISKLAQNDKVPLFSI